MILSSIIVYLEVLSNCSLPSPSSFRLGYLVDVVNSSTPSPLIHNTVSRFTSAFSYRSRFFFGLCVFS